MTVEEIRNLISEAEYDYIGIRADSRDYQIGEVMDNSHQLFQDPQYTDFECTQSCYIHTFQKVLIPDSMMAENLMAHVHLKYLRAISKK